MRVFKQVVIIFFLITFKNGFCQSLTAYRIGVDAEASTILSSDSVTPFWLRSNQYGTVPMYAPAAVLQARVFRDYWSYDSSLTHRKKFDWGFVVNPMVTWDKQQQAKFLLPEAHVKLRFRQVEVYAGRRKELIGIGDSTLSSGFFAGSGNALPIPKIQIATIGYVPLAFTGKFIAVNAAFAHGWINTPPYLEGARLHQKHLYFKFGKPSHRVKVYFGINHQVQWAGHSDYLKKHPELALNGQLPASWQFFPNVVFAYTPANWDKKSGYTSYDSYRLGNHLGSYDAGIEANIWGRKLLIYHQHPYEDFSSLAFKNAPDGLWGFNYAINVDRYKPWGFKLTRLTAEFLTTKSQTGPTFYIPGSKYQGGDNYFNHGQYTEGWSYFGRTIGTPFIAPRNDMIISVPEGGNFFPNNRINMWYTGAQFIYREDVLVTVRTSYSRNFGIAGVVRDPVIGQFSGLLSCQIPVPDWLYTYVSLKIGIDSGDLFKNSVAGSIGVRKSW